MLRKQSNAGHEWVRGLKATLDLNFFLKWLNFQNNSRLPSVFPSIFRRDNCELIHISNLEKKIIKKLEPNYSNQKHVYRLERQNDKIVWSIFVKMNGRLCQVCAYMLQANFSSIHYILIDQYVHFVLKRR